MKDINDMFIEFCESVKNGFGSISDATVRSEFERINERKLNGNDLAKLLSLLETNDLIDKKASVNKASNFYQIMYKKLNERNEAVKV